MPSFRNAGPTCAYSTPVNINDGTQQLCAANPPNSLLAPWVLLGGAPSIVFDAPRPGDVFTIAAAGPKMPEIAVRLHLAGILPDPTERTEFHVEAVVEFDSADCPNGTRKNGTSTQFKSAKPTVQFVGGGHFTLVLTEILGGNLKLKVSAAVGGAQITAELTGVRIQGQDPGADLIKAQLTEKVVWRIVQQESHGGHQFAAAPLAGGALYPLYSGDRKLGVGLGQITKLASELPLTKAEVWDWTANLASAEAKVRQTRRVSDNFVKHVRNSSEFKQLVVAYNADRVTKKLPALTVTLPDLTADQCERDSVRGYNGFAGSDELCTDQVLHEYRVAQKDGLLVVDVVAGTTTGKARWEVVPADDRPDSGDPDYVANVYKHPA
jgi:hypothetical protein